MARPITGPVISNVQNNIHVVNIIFLDIIHRPFYLLKHNISETGFCLHVEVKPTQLGPVNRASPYLRTPAPTQVRVCKPSTAQTISESLRQKIKTVKELHTYEA
jgi:hypothetical protein